MKKRGRPKIYTEEEIEEHRKQRLIKEKEKRKINSDERKAKRNAKLSILRQDPAWAHREKRKMRSYCLRTKYGITVEDFINILKKQNYLCAACNTKLDSSSKKTHIDHDHVTNKVRGILCHNCNVALGHLHDSINRVYMLAEYLKRTM